MTYCELLAAIILGGGSIEDWPDLHEEMLREIDEMIWGEA